MADLITFIDKVNNPELLALVQQYGDNEYLTAEQINAMRDAINFLNENKLDKPQLNYGSVLFYDGNAIAQDNANFFYNNGSFGIGTNSPIGRLNVKAQGILTTDIAFNVSRFDSNNKIFYITGKGEVCSPGNGGNQENVAFGINVFSSNTTGYGNVGVGFNALSANTKGKFNIAFGKGALFSNTTHNGNVAIGFNTLFSSVAQLNIAIGTQAMEYSTSGHQNVAIGYQALQYNTSGQNNIALGLRPLNNNVSGTANIAIGDNSLSNNTTGNVNVAISNNALGRNATGIQNIGIGAQSLYENRSGSDNIAHGVNSLGKITTGSNNVGFGNMAGYYIANGVSINTQSDNSIFIGANTRSLAINQSNEIVIGHQAIGLGSNTVVLGNSSIITTALRGNILVGTTTSVASSKLTIDSTTQGFLKPRMTQAQRLAIASPATGLEVYQTDGVEGTYIKKAAGWQFAY